MRENRTKCMNKCSGRNARLSYMPNIFTSATKWTEVIKWSPFITCRNLRFRQVCWSVGLSICPSVCLSVCLFALYRPQFSSDFLQISWEHATRLSDETALFWSPKVKGQGQGHRKGQNRHVAISPKLIAIETWNQRHIEAWLMAKPLGLARPSKGQWPRRSPEVEVDLP